MSPQDRLNTQLSVRDLRERNVEREREREYMTHARDCAAMEYPKTVLAPKRSAEWYG